MTCVVLSIHYCACFFFQVAKQEFPVRCLIRIDRHGVIAFQLYCGNSTVRLSSLKLIRLEMVVVFVVYCAFAGILLPRIYFSAGFFVI